MNLNSVPNVIYDLIDLVINGATITLPSGFVLDGSVGIMKTPYDGIEIRPSDSDEVAPDDKYLVLDYAPDGVKFMGLSDMEVFHTDDEEVVHKHKNQPFRLSMELREVHGMGGILQDLQKYKENEKVKLFCEEYNFTFVGYVGNIKTVPFGIGNNQHKESMVECSFYFMDNWEIVNDYYENIEIQSTLINADDTIISEEVDSFGEVENE